MNSSRNIVLITLDSLRADHCSFMGYHRKTTPTIDKMAKSGLYFENAIAASIATAPSMFTVLTGEYPTLESNNYNPNDWRKEISTKKTISEYLSAMGYYTVAFSPNIAFSSYFGFSKGFHYFDDFSNHQKFRPHERFQKVGSTKLTRFFIYLYDILSKKGGATPWEDIFDHIHNIVKKLRKPYFIWILLLDTHFPYVPPRKYRKWGGYMHILYSNYLAYQGPFSNYVEKIFSKMIDARNIYDDCIRYADKFVKTLWNMLKDDDPIFIIHADHGEGFGEHGYFGHPPGYPVVLYEEFIHVPLVIYNGDVKGKISKPVSLRLLPLIIKNIVNENYSIFNKSLNKNKFAITKVFDRGRLKIAIRSERWKFITGQSKTDELYDLSNDPREQENLIYAHSDIAEEMRGIVDSHIKREIERKRIRERISRIKKNKLIR